MTAADHANTVRKALSWMKPGVLRADATAALDALAAQAETAETLPPAHSAQWWQEVAEDLDERIKAMRAERDLALQAASDFRAERDAAVQAAEQLREALRFYAKEVGYTWVNNERGTIQSNDRGAIARAALGNNT